MSNNLLDTHAFIWFISGDDSLSAAARQAIEAENVTNYVSIASLWEIAVKISLGKLELKRQFSTIESQIYTNGFQLLPILFEDTLRLTNLPFFHKDPFDRVIISQSITNSLTIITRDQYFHQYPVKIIW